MVSTPSKLLMRQHICAPTSSGARFKAATPQFRASKTWRGPCWIRAETLTGEYYEDAVNQLAERTISRTTSLSGRPRYVVGVAGPPGAGKSTLVQAVAARINSLDAGKPAVVLPMDGFHYYRRELDAMDDPAEAHARRGAHWTFNAPAFVSCVRAAKEQPRADVPSFDHGVGDPVEGDIIIEEHHKIVLVEGNYLLLDIPPWTELQELLDDTWFLELPLDTAMLRVFMRQTSLGLSAEESKRRIRYNDFPNAELVDACKVRAHVTLPADLPFRG